MLVALVSLNVMAEPFVIVHNKHNKDSRDFVSLNAGNFKVIDFYDYDNQDTKNFMALGIQVSDFPSVVDLGLKIVSLKPSSMEAGLIEIKVNERFRIDKAVKDIEFGKELIATVRLSSIDRGLTESQTNQIETSMLDVTRKLFLGKIAEARTMIAAITPDGVLITAALKDRVLSKIDNYLMQ